MICPVVVADEMSGLEAWARIESHRERSDGDGTYPARALERAMKIQEVILRAMSGEILWMQAAEIIGISDRSMRRWRERYEEHGYDGLFDRRTQRPSPKRVPMATVEKVLRLYREKYFDFNVRHFVEKVQKEHGIDLSYTWIKTALQTAGLVAKSRKRGTHRKKRPRRPLPGMMLHVDGSTHTWLEGDQRQDLIAILDDATTEVYYARLVAQESSATVMAGLRSVIEQKGLFCSLYWDRGSHFFRTPVGGEPPEKAIKTQIARALGQLGIEMIPAYSPQARGRCERFFGTWQGRLPQELRWRGITTMEGADKFLRRYWIRYHNGHFTTPAGTIGNGICALYRDRSQQNLLAPGRTCGRQQQHGEVWSGASADPTPDVSLQHGEVSGAGVPAPG